jgi:hypothetical protein
MSLVKKTYHCKVIRLTNTKQVALQQEYDNLQHYLQFIFDVCSDALVNLPGVKNRSGYFESGVERYPQYIFCRYVWTVKIIIRVITINIIDRMYDRCCQIL